MHPTRVLGISLNTYDLSDVEARRACDQAQRETGLPATDPVRFDPAPLINAIADERERYLRRRKALESDSVNPSAALGMTGAALE